MPRLRPPLRPVYVPVRPPKVEISNSLLAVGSELCACAVPAVSAATTATDADQCSRKFLRRNPSPYVSHSKTDKRSEGGQSRCDGIVSSQFGSITAKIRLPTGEPDW